MSVPYRDQVKIGKLAAAGMSGNKIAESVRVHPNTVRSILKKEDIKAIMEQEQLRLAKIVPRAVKNMEMWVEGATKTKDPQLIDIGYKSTKDILQAQGLLSDNPSHFSKVTINQQINIIPPVIGELLKKYGEELHLSNSEEVIDVEIQEKEEKSSRNNTKATEN